MAEVCAGSAESSLDTIENYGETVETSTIDGHWLYHRVASPCNVLRHSRTVLDIIAVLTNDVFAFRLLDC